MPIIRRTLFCPFILTIQFFPQPRRRNWWYLRSAWRLPRPIPHPVWRGGHFPHEQGVRRERRTRVAWWYQPSLLHAPGDSRPNRHQTSDANAVISNRAMVWHNCGTFRHTLGFWWLCFDVDTVINSRSVGLKCVFWGFALFLLFMFIYSCQMVVWFQLL